MVVGSFREERELLELREMVAFFHEQEPRLRKEIDCLQKDLTSSRLNVSMLQQEKENASYNAERWKQALMDKEKQQQQDASSRRLFSNNSQQIIVAQLQQSVQEQKDIIDERDKAIETLVNHSLQDDAKMSKEVSRLQQENDIFADQILDQEEEFQRCRRLLQVRDNQMLSLRQQISDVQTQNHQFTSIQSNNQTRDQECRKLEQERSQLRAQLAARDRHVQQLEDRLNHSLENQDAKKLQAEVEELREENETNRSELRDLRRQSWSAKEASGEATDLKLELAQAKHALQEVQRTQKHRIEQAKFEAKNELRTQLELAVANNRTLERRLDQFEKLRKREIQVMEQLEAKLEKEDTAMNTSIDDGNPKIRTMAGKKETEQVLRQELEAVKYALNVSESERGQLEKEFIALVDAKSKAAAAADVMHAIPESDESLVRENEELSKAYESMLIEKENLLTEFASVRNAGASLQKLEIQVEQAKNAREASEKAITTSYEGLLSTLSSEKDATIDGLKKEILAYQAKSSGEIAELETRISMLQNMSTEKEELVVKLAKLETELTSVRAAEPCLLEGGTHPDFTKNAHEASEKAIATSYECQLSTLSSEKDSTIDGLRKEILAYRTQSAEEITKLETHIGALQSENTKLREHYDAELEKRNNRIYALEHILHAQEKTVDSMRTEMDQLQTSMHDTTHNRRTESEDLEQELMVMQSQTTKQEREITVLKMKLQESKLGHKTEIEKLNEVILDLEKESPLARTVAELQNDERMLMVRERLEQLKAKNTELQEENLKLGGRLERAVIKIQSVEAEKEIAEETEQECISLRRQLRQLEHILENMQRLPEATPRMAVIDKENGEVKQKQSLRDDQISPSRRRPKSNGSLKGMFKRRSQGSQVTTIEEAR